MNGDEQALLSSLIGPAYAQWFLRELSLMDANNFPNQVGAGEREGRVVCPLVAARHMEGQKVLWSRIDQKTCLKSILAAGFEPVIIEPTLLGDQLETNVEEFERRLEEGGESILAVLSTTSCFAPRAPDDVESLAKLCKKYGVPHLINNAYGLQSSKLTHVVEQAGRTGRVDAFVQSTDKNFLVPVGGAVIGGFAKEPIQAIAKTYPGRASSVPTIDVLTTLLWLGETGWQRLLKSRKERFLELRSGLEALAERLGNGARVLATPANPISLALALEGVLPPEKVTELGSLLFRRRVSGARAWAPAPDKTIEGISFTGWGSHCGNFPKAYLNVAAAVGMKAEEVPALIARLEKTINELVKASS